jgi:hypothetical protein
MGRGRHDTKKGGGAKGLLDVNQLNLEAEGGVGRDIRLRLHKYFVSIELEDGRD